MKRLVLVHFMALLMLAIDPSEASFFAGGRSRSKKLGNDQKTRETPYVCLDAFVDLPACNFGSEEDEQIQRRSHSRRESAQLESMETFEDSEELTSRDFPVRRYSRSLTIVYKIEGCIPSRLPFDLPKCKIEDTTGKIIEVRRLFPFTVAGPSEPDLEPPLILPEFDMDQWRRNMKRPWVSPINNKNEAENSNEEFTEDQNIELTMLKLPKRKKVERDETIEKKNVLKKIVPRDDMREIQENGITSKNSWSILANKLVTNHRVSDTNSYKTGNSRINNLIDDHWTSQYRYEFPYAKAIPYDPKKLQLARKGNEFPYSRAIPYDPKKLQLARQGNEFPYSRAIPYDPKKLAKRKDEMIEASRSHPFQSRRLKFVETRSADFHDDVPFDTSMIDAAKDGGIFPYVKEIPGDTSKSLRPLETLKSREPEKIKVPVRHVMTFWKEEVPVKRRIMRDIEDEKHFRKNILQSENENKKFEILSIPRRIVRSPMESSTSDFTSINDDLEIPSRWSEFPYSRAIPFDPEKLRHPRSMMEHRASSLLDIPRDFPYAKAIPYDPWKLSAFKRKQNQSRDERSSSDERTFLARLKRAPLNY